MQYGHVRLCYLLHLLLFYSGVSPHGQHLADNNGAPLRKTFFLHFFSLLLISFIQRAAAKQDGKIMNEKGQQGK